MLPPSPVSAGVKFLLATAWQQTHPCSVLRPLHRAPVLSEPRLILGSAFCGSHNFCALRLARKELETTEVVSSMDIQSFAQPCVASVTARDWGGYMRPKYPSLRKLLPSCKVYLMTPSSKKSAAGYRHRWWGEVGHGSVDYTSNLYPDTFMLLYGGDDGTDRRHLHRGFECYSLVVRRRKKTQDFLWNRQGVWNNDGPCEK